MEAVAGPSAAVKGRAGKRRWPGLALHVGPHPAPCRCLLTADQSLLLAANRCVPRAPIGQEGGSDVTQWQGGRQAPHTFLPPPRPARPPASPAAAGAQLEQKPGGKLL